MKKVQKNDLVNLIAQFYCNFVNLQPVSDIAKGTCGVYINVDSIYIQVLDFNRFDSDEEQEARLQKFAEQIEAITFGNLKVTYKGCKHGINFKSWLYIANAYEVEFLE